MLNFVKAGFGSPYPKESGMYVVAIITRDGDTVLRVLGFDAETYSQEKWLRTEVSEYGYTETTRFSADYINAWAKLEGIELQIVPEVVKLSIPGIKEEEEE